MFEGISLKIKNAREFAKTHHFMLLAMVCVIALLVIALFSLTQILELKSDARDYETKITDMTVQMQQWEQAAEENKVLMAENKEVADKNAALIEENNNIIATNSELERQNGELSKKFDGLSKPQ